MLTPTPEESHLLRADVWWRVIGPAILLSPFCLTAQVLMEPSTPGGTVQLIANDEAVMETEEIKKDLPCTVTSVKPLLGFDLRFHSGYDVAIPLKELAGPKAICLPSFFASRQREFGSSGLLFTALHRARDRRRRQRRRVCSKAASTWVKAIITWRG